MKTIIQFVESIRAEMPECTVMLYGEDGVLSIKTLDNNGFKFQKRYTHAEILSISQRTLIEHYITLAHAVRARYSKTLGI
jgi:hypothetical protein